jgi:hypothetical protein
LATALMMLVTVAGASHAQMGGGHGGRQRSQQPPAPQPQPSTAPTPSKLMPEIWPRLDIGAILCKSRDDLVRYQMKTADGPGVAVPGKAPDCLVIGKQTAIQILDRDGPSRTQVAFTAEASQTGWTNSYLPSTPPPSVAMGTSAAK